MCVRIHPLNALMEPRGIQICEGWLANYLSTVESCVGCRIDLESNSSMEMSLLRWSSSHAADQYLNCQNLSLNSVSLSAV